MFNNIYRYSLFVLLSGVLIWGCSEHDQMLNAPENSTYGKLNNNLNLELSSTTILNGYTVDYLGQIVDGSFTTFSYKVTGNNYPPALSFFLIEIPGCYRNLGITYTPMNSVDVGLDPVTGIYGIKWSFPVDINADQEYTITFNGFLEEGFTRAAVKGSNHFEAGNIGGPDCIERYDISGTVFVDADSNSYFTDNEVGIENITVALISNGQVIDSTQTDHFGNYIFRDEIAGIYTLRIKTDTQDNDFNEQLGALFRATTDTSLSVIIGPNTSGNNFGHKPLTQKIIYNFDAGLLQGNGKTLKFWLQQTSLALKDKGNPKVDPTTLQAYLDYIEGTMSEPFFLYDPYQFDDINEFQAAYNILNDNTGILVNELKAELLAAELNFFADLGIVGNRALFSVLLAWGESLVKQAGTTTNNLKQSAYSINARSSDLGDAVKIFKEVNITSGGGGEGL